MKCAAWWLLFAAGLWALAVGGCGAKPKKKKKSKPVKWEEYASAKVGVKLQKPEGFTEVAPGTFTDGEGGYISASFDKGDTTLEALVNAEVIRKQKDTQSNFKTHKITDWKKAFVVERNEKIKMSGHDAVDLLLILAKKAEENAPREKRMAVWVKVDGGIISVAWWCPEEKWDKYFERYFKKSRESLSITK